jgi:hypothetical protein
VRGIHFWGYSLLFGLKSKCSSRHPRYHAARIAIFLSLPWAAPIASSSLLILDCPVRQLQKSAPLVAG